MVLRVSKNPSGDLEYTCEGGTVASACSDPYGVSMTPEELTADDVDSDGYTCFVEWDTFVDYDSCGYYSYSYDYCDPIVEDLIECACDEYGEGCDYLRRERRRELDGDDYVLAGTCANWQAFPQFLEGCSGIDEYPNCRAESVAYTECVYSNLAYHYFGLDCNLICPEPEDDVVDAAPGRRVSALAFLAAAAARLLFWP